MSNSRHDVLIYGAGGFGAEVAWLVEDCETAGLDIRMAGFIDDASQPGQLLNGHPVFSLTGARDVFPDALIVSAVGTPKVREVVVDAAKNRGWMFGTLVHPSVKRSKRIEVGEGTVICAGSVLTTNISVGRHVQINLNCTIGHNASISDFVTISPGVHVSGWVRLERGVFVGTGAVFVNGTEDNPLVIGERAVVGAGACVTKAVKPGDTVVGVPAKSISTRPQ